MKYIVLSDTHSEDIPQVLLEDIKESDGIIHVGDFCDVDLFNRLKKMKNLHCVYGNMDGSDLRFSDAS
jgi:putative phosphoesterase